jgi:2-dehydro-3-deoxygluconokinase
VSDTSATVLTFGEPLVAFVPNAPGPYSEGQALTPFPAGAELNTAVGLARLEVPVAYACAVGRDPFGQLIVRHARAEAVDARHVETSQRGQTALLFKQWTGLAGGTSVHYYRSTSPMAQGAWEPTAVVDEIRAGHYRWVHSTGITWMLNPETARWATEILRVARASGAVTSFDVNLRFKLGPIEAWQHRVSEVVPHLTWFILGDEEAEALFETSDATEVERRVRELGFAGDGVILKRGAAGAAACFGGILTEVPAWPVPRVVDTVGAGDGFNAGWIAGMCRGWTQAEALQLGAVVGAFAVTRTGDHDGYPTWSEAMHELAGTKGVLR